MQQEMFLLGKRLVEAVEDISCNVSSMLISLNDLTTDISYLVAEKRHSEMPDLSFSSNIIQHTSKVTSDSSPITAFDDQLVYIGSGDGEGEDVTVEQAESKDAIYLPVEGTTPFNRQEIYMYPPSWSNYDGGLQEVRSAWQLLDEEVPLSSSPKWEPSEEPNYLMDTLLNEPVQLSETALIPKAEPMSETEEELEETEYESVESVADAPLDVGESREILEEMMQEQMSEDCCRETRTLQSVTNVMGINCDISIPSCSYDCEEHSSSKNTLKKRKEQTSEEVLSAKRSSIFGSVPKEMAEEPLSVNPCSTIKDLNTKDNSRSAPEDSKRNNIEAEYRDIRKNKKQTHVIEETRTKERQRCSSPNINAKECVGDTRNLQTVNGVINIPHDVSDPDCSHLIEKVSSKNTPRNENKRMLKETLRSESLSKCKSICKETDRNLLGIPCISIERIRTEGHHENALEESRREHLEAESEGVDKYVRKGKEKVREGERSDGQEKRNLCSPKTYSKQSEENTKNKGSSHDTCGKSFRDNDNLVNHSVVHTSGKPFKCSICEKSFTEKGSLTRHFRIHTGERPFVCSCCGKSFNQSGYLSLHMRQHTGERPYKCDVCKKSFSRKPYLSNHMRLHTNEKPFKCTVCKKTFAQSYNLTVHMWHHTGERHFSCTICGKHFSQANSLSYHIRHVHRAPVSTS